MMGKFDWLKPKPPVEQSTLELYVSVACNVVNVQNGDFWQTTPVGHLKITYPMGKFFDFKCYQEGYKDYYLANDFDVPLRTLGVELESDIPVPPPIDDNHLDRAIDNRYDVVDKDLFEDAILIKDRTIVYEWGNVDADQDNLASVCRVWTNLIWADWISRNGFEWLDKWCRELPASTAQTINSDMAVSNLLSYTTPHTWIYSGGKDNDGIARWPKQFQIIRELYNQEPPQVIQERIFDRIGGGLRAWMISDGTMRVGGSVRNLFKFARLMFNRGSWNNEQIISAEYVDRSLSGGPNGNGVPFDLEGYQTHLIRNGSAWEMENALPGVPDGFMARSSKSYIIGIPSLGLIMAGKGPEQFQDVFLPQIVQLMKG